MKPETIIRGVSSLLVTLGAAKITKKVIENNVEPEGALERAEILVGSYVLGAIVAEAANQYAKKKIDEAVKFWHMVKSPDKTD